MKVIAFAFRDPLGAEMDDDALQLIADYAQSLVIHDCLGSRPINNIKILPQFSLTMTVLAAHNPRKMSDLGGAAVACLLGTIYVRETWHGGEMRCWRL
jgi:hypothetical protein